MPAGQSCGTCLFCVVDDGQRQCRYNPPINQTSWFPSVSADDWCGHWNLMPVGTNAYGTIYYPVPYSEPVSALDDLLAGYVLPVADETSVSASDDQMAGYVLSVADEAMVSASDDQAASTI